MSEFFLRQSWYDLFPAIVLREEMLFVPGEIFAHIVGDEIMFLRQPEPFARRLGEFGAAFAVRLGCAGHFRDAFPDQGMGDDHLRFPVVALLCDMERVEEGLHVLAVDFLHVEAISAEARAGVFALRFLRHRVEGNGVGVVDQDQVIEPEMAGKSARFRRDALLQTTIAGETDDVLIENAVLSAVKTRGGHFRRHRNPDRVTYALAQRAGRALDSRGFTKLRMSGSFAVQLPKALDFRHRQIVAAQVQPGVEEHAAVPGGENEIIAIDPARLVGVVLERVAIKNSAHLGAA